MPYKDPEKRREYNRKYRETHREETRNTNREACHRWRELYPEKRRESDRKSSRKYRELHPEEIKIRYREKSRRYRKTHSRTYLKCKYGIDNAIYEQLLADQNGVCAVCGENRGKKELGIDHDHTTGKIRGLLCMKCNLALGFMDDNLGWLQRLVDYIKQSKGVVNV